MLTVQTISLDSDARRAWSGDEEVRLSRKEFDLLQILMRNAGKIVSRDELMLEVWNTGFWTSSKTIDVHLGWLRRKIGDNPRRPHLISTLRGKGLRFEVEDPREATTEKTAAEVVELPASESPAPRPTDGGARRDRMVAQAQPTC